MMGWTDKAAPADAGTLRGTAAGRIGRRTGAARRPAVPVLPGPPAASGARYAGTADDWLAEWKYDGIRAQLVRRAHQSWLWSRGEDLITERFPEVARIDLPEGCVVDGEIVIWKNGMPAPFADLQKRIGRKTVSAKLLAELPAAFIAYDLLEHQGVDIRGLPQRERRALLETLVAAVADPVMTVSPLIRRTTGPSWRRCARARALRAVEGMMLKSMSMPRTASAAPRTSASGGNGRSTRTASTPC
jgi:DNA ligase-1